MNYFITVRNKLQAQDLQFLNINYSLILGNPPADVLRKANSINPMNTTRRNFIKATAIAAVFAGTDLFASLVSAAETSHDPLAQIPSEILADPSYFLTAEDFKKRIGANFSLIRGNGATTAQLYKVTQSVRPTENTQNTSASAQTVTKETFTLTFRAPAGNFPQATYKLWHPNFGQFNLFLVPGAKASGMILLHAVINRI